MIINKIQQLNIELGSDTPIIIYGAGVFGKYVYEYLKTDYYICGVGISKGCKLPNNEVFKVEVDYIDALIEKNKDAKILLAILNYMECLNDLSKMGVLDRVLILESDVYNYLDEQYLQCQIEIFEKIKRDGTETHVGYVTHRRSDYPEKRAIINRIEDVRYIKMPAQRFRKQDNTAEGCYVDENTFCPSYSMENIDIIHTCDAVCFTNLPWIASYESWFPRMFAYDTDCEKEYYNELCREIVKDNCKAIFPISQNAYDINRHVLKSRVSDELAEAILAKTHFIDLPQPILVSNEQFEKKHKNNRIHFVFIGSTFFLKGGREFIDVLSEYQGKQNFEVTIISEVLGGDYITNVSMNETQKWKQYLQNEEWIEWYEGLPNEEVLQLISERATVGVFPSYADTYGFALLELQAAGCPTITSNVRAFPENNDNECGWICELPVNRFNDSIRDDLEVMYGNMRRELHRVLDEIFENPEMIAIKGRKALERIALQHDPHKYSEALKKYIIMD